MRTLLRVRISWKCLVSFLSASTATLVAELHYVARIVHIVVIVVVQFRRVECVQRVNAHANEIWLLDDALYAQEVPEYKAYIEFQKRAF